MPPVLDVSRGMWGITRTPILGTLRSKNATNSWFWIRNVALTRMVLSVPKKHQLPPRPKWLIIEEEIDEKFLKGGKGPGGQKINKTNSKVQLTHKPTGIVVTCQYSRSQENNRKKAREILAMRLEDIQNPEGSRNAVLQKRASVLKKNLEKKARRKHRQAHEKRRDENRFEELQATITDPEKEFEQMLASYRLEGKNDTGTKGTKEEEEK